MKLTFLIILLGCLQVSAHVNGQNMFTLDMSHVSVDKVLNKIQKESDYRFFYNERYLKHLNPVSLKIKEASISEVLDQLLDGALSYKILDNHLIVISPRSNLSEEHTVQGTITDEKGTPLVGVTVKVKGTSLGTVSNSKGSFVLVVPDSAILEVSYIGYQTQEIAVENQTHLDVQLKTSASGLNEVVVVGYGTQKKKDVTGAISTVEGKQLTVAPIASVANMLAGRLPGLISLQSSGQPGYDAANLSIRGFGSALVIVDGVEADFNTLDPNEIESISILKDGAASIYGSRAGNGVILVTTKRGTSGKPTITVNSSYTMQGLTDMPKPVNAGQYAEMERETWIQSGQPEANAPFTEEQIKKYYEGTDPLYPNTNWYDVLVRDWAPQQQHNLSIRGGSDRVKYYGFLGYLDQSTMWKKGGGGYSRYNFQSNIDAKVLDNLSFHLTLGSTVEQRRFPERPESAGTGGLWSDFWQTLPIYPATLPDPTKVSFAGGGGVGGVNVTSNRGINGYNNTNDQHLNGTLALDYTFNAIKGLSAKAFINYAQYYTSNKQFLKPVKFYTYDPASKIYTLVGSYGSEAQLTYGKYEGTTLTEQLSLNYDRVFNQYHHFTFLALYEAIDYASESLNAARFHFLTPSIDQLFGGSTNGMSNDGSASQMGRKSLVGRLNYAYKDKYLVEGIIRADASAKFPPGKRWGYFPSVSLGWRLSQESFMQGINHLDELKLRLGYGQSGNDGVGNYQYLSGYNLTTGFGGTYLYGASGPQQGLISAGLANPNLTWEKINIYNAGIDFSLYDRKLYGSADVFYRKLNGIPATRINTLPSSFGSSLPPENINSQNNRGFELKLGTNGYIRDLYWDISGNISWSRAKWGHYEEPVYTDSDQVRLYKNSGRWTDRQYGYLTDGLFTSQKQIDALSYDMDNQQNQTLRPGDLIIKDVNGDGKVDWRDQVEIGKGTTPHIMLGLNINLKYKNFDLSTLFQGAMGYYTYILYSHGEKVPPEIMYKLRWTEENDNPHALVPRLGGAPTNLYGSDYYYRKAGYVRLKTFSLGYNLPKRLLDPIGIAQVRVYTAGTNLLTFDKLKKYDIDPEAPSSLMGRYYPQQRTISFGVNVSF